jgi:hypothetical protein
MTPLLLAALLASSQGLSAPELWELWPQARFVPAASPCLRHQGLVERLKALEAKHPGDLTLEEIGRSFEGRSIHLLRLGTGPHKILLWSQMHGDEPSATPALLDLADFLLSRPEQPEVRTILAGTTLLMIPMLNPDGVERYQRRNAQGIDINRDALNLATPEGRLLKLIRDRFQPELGFNLHDQNRRTAVGATGALATISLLAVAGDAQGTLTPGRARAKRACAAVVSTLRLLLAGGIARYDEDWSPRAFGDNLTAWGTPVVLIESGGLAGGRSLPDLTRLNFVALYRVLADLVRDDLAGHDPALYEDLPRNQSDAFADVIVRGGQILVPGGRDPFRADLAFDALESDVSRAGCPSAPPAVGSRITEVGDARFLAAGRSVEAQGTVTAPAFTVSVRGGRAREWLTVTSLEALARLGVGTVRWQVDAAERGAASEAAQRLVGPARARLVVTGGDEPDAGLRLEGPPTAARNATLAGVLEALAGRGWRDRMAGQPSVEFLSRLATGALTVGAPASLVVLRPAPDGSLDPEQARLEAVWLDGREVR